MKKSGYIAILGRPNVGKSTLLNALLGRKLSIITRKPQTTRHQILGIVTKDDVQAIYMDTPGIHSKEHKAMNRYMNKAALSVVQDADVIVFMVAGTKFEKDDEKVLQALRDVKAPVILAVNKVDLVKNKDDLLPWLEGLSQKMTFADVVPISAKKKQQVDVLEKTICQYLPESDFLYPEDMKTDRDESFIIAEKIREKIMRQLGEELPYATTVVIDQIVEEESLLRIAATIYVEKPGQKAIVIGEHGKRLKSIGEKARKDLENYFGQKVFLKTWVKVKDSWSDDAKALKGLGYDDS